MMKMNDIQQQLKTLNTTMEGKMNEILKNNPSVIEYNDLSKQVESNSNEVKRRLDLDYPLSSDQGT